MKRYGELVAVDGVSFALRAGQCLGLLGPNGAGKTTTIEVLEGLLPADAGQVRLFGQGWGEGDLALRQRIGVQLQETRLPDKLTVGEVLELFASFYDAPREIAPLLRTIGLEEKRDARTSELSGGQHQRLALGCALVGDPELLILDEPTTGLDPQARRRVWEVVEEFKGRGGSVLLTTHYMDEAERLADELVIVDLGRVISEGTPRAIIDSLGADAIVQLGFEGEAPAALPTELGGLDGVAAVREHGGGLELRVASLHRSLPLVLAAIERSPATLDDLNTHRPNLEDVFVHLTGRQLRDG